MAKSEPKMTEEEIAGVAQLYFQTKGWDLYPEVVIPNFGGRPDLVGTKQQLVMIAEVKTSLSYPVIEQLTRWRHTLETATKSQYADESKLGIPHLLYAVVGSSNGALNISDLKREILERHRIGVLVMRNLGDPNFSDRPENTFDSYGYAYIDGIRWRVNETLPARIQPGSRQTAHRIFEHLNPDMRCIAPGVSGKKGGYMTPFKRTIEKAKAVLAQGGEFHIDTIIAEINKTPGGHHYCNDAMAKQSISKFLVEFGIATRPENRPVFTLKV